MEDSCVAFELSVGHVVEVAGGGEELDDAGCELVVGPGLPSFMFSSSFSWFLSDSRSRMSSPRLMSRSSASF